MKKYLSNVVLSCETVEEYTVAKIYLALYDYQYEDFEDSLELEVYRSLSPECWGRVLTGIEDLLAEVKESGGKLHLTLDSENSIALPNYVELFQVEYPESPEDYEGEAPRYWVDVKVEDFYELRYWCKINNVDMFY